MPKKDIFKGVGDEVARVTDDMAWANVEVPGTGTHTSNALRRAGWDGRTPMAAIQMTVDGNTLKGSQWILRGSLGEVTFPLQRIQSDKSLKVTIDLNDLSKVKFPQWTQPRGGGTTHCG